MTYTLTEIELQTKAKEFLSENHYRLWCILQGESLVEDVVNAMLSFNKLLSPPLPSGAKKEDIQPVTEKEYNQFEKFYLENYISPDIDDAYLEGIKLMLSAIWLQLSPSKSSQKQSLIELMESDQRDGMYGVRENAGWISVKDRLPELKNKYDEDNDRWYDESDFVMVANEVDYYGQLASYDGDGLWWLWGEAEPFDMVAYWMPVPLLPNSDKNVQECDASKAKSMGEPMAQNSPAPQNAQKEPVIDNERAKEGIIAIIKDCLRIDENNNVPNYEIAEARLRMAGRMIYRYLKSKGEPVIDWDRLELDLDEWWIAFKLSINNHRPTRSAVVNWLKSNLSNYYKVNQH